jgi:hypothetical protein
MTLFNLLCLSWLAVLLFTWALVTLLKVMM